MRPRDMGETTLMVCCGREIECTLERHQEWHQTIVYAAGGATVVLQRIGMP